MRWSASALTLLLVATAAQAQTMRPFTTFRQMHGETRLSARLQYAAGRLDVAPGDGNDLYRMDLSYDQDRFVPVSDYDPVRGAVALGLKSAGSAGVRVSSRNQLQQVASVTISRRVDLSLALYLGAAEAQVELGGLRLTNLDLRTGASQTVVSFSRPNGARCRRAAFSAGAAEISVLGLGNSRCDEIEFEGGMGSITLDFGGAWSSSSRVHVKMAVGELTLRLPRQVGVRLTMDKILSSFEPTGLVRQGDAFVSPSYERASRRLDLDLTTVAGGVSVEWVD
ncbi:MAG TPA: hypothetical protein VFU40_08250 [Gemmatimonadales bacterium]|nr:hypothetical protein [Gemmatimonadales bacterium]